MSTSLVGLISDVASVKNKNRYCYMSEVIPLTFMPMDSKIFEFETLIRCTSSTIHRITVILLPIKWGHLTKLNFGRYI